MDSVEKLENIKNYFDIIEEIPEVFRHRGIPDEFDCLISMDDNHLLVVRSNYYEYRIYSTEDVGCIGGGAGYITDPIEAIEGCFKQVGINIEYFPVKDAIEKEFY